MNFTTKSLLLIAAALSVHQAKAQLYVEAGATLHISSGATLAVNAGDVNLLADISSPSGTAGRLLMNGSTGQTLGSNGKIIPILQVDNPQGIALSSATVVRDSLVFTNGSITLATSNLIFGNNGVPVGANVVSHVVTNAAGSVTKQGLPQNESFSFPIGRTAQDYTPVTINNENVQTRDFSVLVKTYADTSRILGNFSSGVNRVWKITSNIPGNAAITLSHNHVTNVQGPGTSGLMYVPGAAYITQYQGNNIWSKSVSTSDGGTPVNSLTASFYIPSGGDSSFFSKTSDQLRALDRGLLLAATALLQAAWNGTNMSNTLSSLTAFPKSQPYNVAPFNYNGTEKVATVPAGVTDWIIVDLRTNSSPSTIVASRACFIKQDGKIVDLDGSSSVLFSQVPEGDYYIALRHRNHLGVMTARARGFLTEHATAYDFSLSQDAGYQDAGITGNEAMASLPGAKFGMWAGNVNSNNAVRLSGLPTVNDYLHILNAALSGNPQTVATNVYNNSDANMNGTVRVNGLPAQNDYLYILNNVLSGNPLKVIQQHSR